MNKKIILAILIILTLNACSLTESITKKGTSQKISNLRGSKGDVEEIDIVVDKSEYKERLTNGTKNVVRLVQVFRKNTSPDILNEYRFLDIKEGSVYELLKLENLDILVAADDYVVPSQETFWQYLNLIKDFKNASIEVRRDGKPMLMKYSFN